MSEITVQFGGQPIVVSFGENTALALSYAASAAASEEAAQAAREDTEALLATAQDFQYDAPAAVGLMQAAARAGRSSVDRAAIAYTKGLYFDFAAAIFVLAGVNAANPNHFPALTATRASAAYALNKAGRYSSFTADTLRTTDRGALIEGAATQVCPQPVDFSNAAWTRSNVQTPTAIPAGAPDNASASYDLIENTNAAAQIYHQIATASLTAGVWTCSVHLQRRGRRYAGMLLTVAAGSSAWIVDFDAPGGPSVAAATGGTGPVAVAFGLIPLGGGVYRLWVAMPLSTAGTINMRVQGFGGPAYADRTYTGTVGTIFARASLAQIERGAVPTSPILANGAIRAADVTTLALPAGNSNDQFEIVWEGGSGKFKRSGLANPNVLNMVTDFGAPWAGSYIQHIALTPALDERLLAANPSGGLPWLVAMDGTFALNSKVYASEAEIMSFLGASVTGSIANIEGYASPDATNLLAGVDFTIDQQGFTLVQDATVSRSDGYLNMTLGSAAGVSSGLACKMVVEPGKAYRFSATLKASVSGGALSLVLVNRTDFAAGRYLSKVTAGVADTAVSVVGAGGFGDGMYVGMFHLPDSPAGLVGSMKNVSLVETSPGPGFPSGNVSVELVGTTPAALPSAGQIQILYQIDAGGEGDRWRVEWRNDKSVHATAQIGGGAGTPAPTADITLGTLDISTAFHLVAGMSATALRGAVNGAGAQVDTMLPVGAAALRIGRDSANASQFLGTITGKIVSAGVETLEWMKARTKPVMQQSGPLPIVAHGDSYSGQGTGYAAPLAELMVPDGSGGMRRRFDVMRTGVGSSTFEDQYNLLIANAAAIKDRTIIWWDGSENGHVNGQWTTEFAQFQAVVAALGHNRILYVRSGQIPAAGMGSNSPTTSRAQSSLDMDGLYEAIRGTHGPSRVFDPLDITRTFISGTPGSDARIKDQSDINFGYAPRSIFVDGAHYFVQYMRAVVVGLPGLPGLADRAAALAR
ncbi:hypothetical protein [Novosphingobium sp. fls2-241-R2A-195]|uniref:phage head spike fiber domain-containing protein n=1 Tax=Novosphingobium sp. fls2-241-R2A-195 TaxID=3040296 RepID=UPI00254C2631|nr:hypothetical protein [Novosphingobium sp. fls2-241-R2A-195]